MAAAEDDELENDLFWFQITELKSVSAGEMVCCLFVEEEEKQNRDQNLTKHSFYLEPHGTGYLMILTRVNPGPDSLQTHNPPPNKHLDGEYSPAQGPGLWF